MPSLSTCFNPCFCGTRARTEPLHADYPQAYAFQSLFLWNSRPDEGGESYLHDQLVVSILVFVELAPGPCDLQLEIDIQRVFQSLFLWNSRPDGGGGAAKDYILMFQSLFLWNSRPDASDQSGSVARFRFQSLFLWNSRPDRVPGVARFDAWRFQSLFLWNSRPDSSSPYFCSPYLCFNPCFCGTRARTASAIPATRPDLCFNPCFCGTRARTTVDVVGRAVMLPFQSLFLWNSRPDSVSMPTTWRCSPRPSSFNPCFCGTRARTSTPGSARWE